MRTNAFARKATQTLSLPLAKLSTALQQYVQSCAKSPDSEAPRTCGTRRDRLLELDALRGIAAVAVVVGHFTSQLHSLGFIDWRFTVGSKGPHLFFIVSGFVILLTLERTRSATDFIVSRASRLYPAYWTAVVVTFALLGVTLMQPPPAENALVNLTMFQAWLGVPDLNVVYWTLSVELRFYAMMLLIFVLGQTRNVEAIGFVWLLAVVAMNALVTADTAIFKVANLLLIPDYGPLFIAGIAFRRLYVYGRSLGRLALVGACLATQIWIDSEPETVICVVSFFGMFILLVCGALSSIATRPMVFIGTVSYSLYLIHEVIGAVLIPRLSSVLPNAFVLCTLPFALSMVVASAITYGIERPALTAIRTHYKRDRNA